MNDAIDPRLGTHVQPKMSSERTFGFVLSTVFLAIALLPLAHGLEMHVWALPFAAVFFGAAIAVPIVLKPLNRLWFLIGILLGRVVTPVVMTIIWFIALTPAGMLMRLFGKDPLRLKHEAATETYWVDRSPPGPNSDSLRNQF